MGAVVSEESGTPVDARMAMARERTGMTSFRTKLAMDRTTLAWIRTALTMATFGFGLIVLAIGAMAATALSHWFTLRRLRRGEPLELTKWPLAIVLALLLALVFLAGLAAILVESGG
jgi:putative membrane protein